MCGIAGIFTLQPEKINVAAHLLQMTKTLRHRGPDDEGFLLWQNGQTKFFAGDDTPDNVRHASLQYTPQSKLTESQTGFNLGFCHRRLSIIDLSAAGHQPMCDVSGKIHLIFNGEIYNYIELREELKQKGVVFRTASDTEVILNAYREWGIDCLQRFNGMWSFVLLDETRKELIAARDRFGVKPFYYYHDAQNFCFASEIKAIVKLPFVHSGINDQAVYDFFVHTEMEYTPHGFFRNITELFPGKVLRLNLRNNAVSEEEYYSLRTNHSYEEFDKKKFSAFRDEIEQLIFESVRLRMRSDVKVGSCLSGGIDSSAIGGMMQRLVKEKSDPYFFTASFSDKEIDESQWAKEVVQNGGSWFKTEPTAADLWRDLDDLVYGQDLPLWSSSTYAQFSVMKAARQAGIKVLLDGQGGDELFAGYVPYYLSFWNEIDKHGSKKTLQAEIQSFQHGTSGRKFRLKENIKSRTQNISFLKTIKDPQLKFLNPDFLNEYAKGPEVKRSYENLNTHLSKEFCNTRLKLYLKCEDRCSMWHSVESRTPFSDDIKLIEKIFSIPGSYKIKNGVLKYLMRESVKNYLPEAIYNRQDKRGYLTPHNSWMRTLSPEISKEDFSTLKPYLNLPRFEKHSDELYAPNDKRERFLGFKILTFNRWKRLFFV